MKLLEGKVAIITGASRGIGSGIAKVFAEQGANVAFTYSSSVESALALENELNALGIKAKGYKSNAADFNEAQKLVDDVIAEFGTIDVLINNAGITRDALTRKMTEEMWDLVIDVNLKGVFNLTRHVGPHMQANQTGSIINIASIVGVFGNIGQANYAASKAGVIGLTKTWAKEFAMKGGNVRVNAIAPGYVMTDILKTVPQDLLDKFAAMTMLGRLGQPEEIAKVALFLASEDASYITGQVIEPNGGMRL